MEKSNSAFNPKDILKDFPILAQKINGNPLVYFDNAASTQKPQSVINAISNYYKTFNANVHRGAHALSDQATQAFEQAREKVQTFIQAEHREEIIWTRGTTEAINLVAQSWGRSNIKKDDEIIVSNLEHHSNIVPWQILCQQKQAKLKVIPIKNNVLLDMAAFEKLINHKTKLVAIGHISNALGTVNPVAQIIKKAHEYGAKVLIDGAQSVAHLPINVQQLDCDFFAFSGHKMYAPTGIGVLYAKQALLEAMPPWQAGGEMIEKVSFDATTYNQLPYKFEAGTPNIAGAIGLAAAIDYLTQLDHKALLNHENQLLQYATQQAQSIDGLKIIGSDGPKAAILSLVFADHHPQDIGMLLDQQGIAVRTGHHCAMPLMDALGLNGTVRASFAFYNTQQEIDKLFAGIKKAMSFL